MAATGTAGYATAAGTPMPAASTVRTPLRRLELVHCVAVTVFSWVLWVGFLPWTIARKVTPGVLEPYVRNGEHLIWNALEPAMKTTANWSYAALYWVDNLLDRVLTWTAHFTRENGEHMAVAKSAYSTYIFDLFDYVARNGLSGILKNA